MVGPTCLPCRTILQAAGARGWVVEQAADGSVSALIAGGSATRVTDALSALLGGRVAVRAVGTIAELGEGKPRRYRAMKPPNTAIATAQIPAALPMDSA